MAGRGQLILTGHLGDVMKESAQAALSYARARSVVLGLTDEIFSKRDIHIHVPDGAIPKDGPSAGITMATALISALTGRPIRHDLAMTGEITLRGHVMPVGGIKEKVLAARRAQMRTVLLPATNRRHIEEVPSSLLQDLEVVFAEDMSEVLDVALLQSARPSGQQGRPRGRSAPRRVSRKRRSAPEGAVGASEA